MSAPKGAVSSIVVADMIPHLNAKICNHHIDIVVFCGE
jgi:hypothetical protein